MVSNSRYQNLFFVLPTRVIVTTLDYKFECFRVLLRHGQRIIQFFKKAQIDG
jgi:hypothetical protein